MIKLKILFVFIIFIITLLNRNVCKADKLAPQLGSIVFDMNNAYIIGDNMNSTNITMTLESPASYPVKINGVLQYSIINSTHLKVEVNDSISLSLFFTFIYTGELNQYRVWKPMYVEKISILPTDGGILTVNGNFFNNTQIKLENLLLQRTYLSKTMALFNVTSNITDSLPSTDNLEMEISDNDMQYFKYMFMTPNITNVIYDNGSLTIIGVNFGSNQSNIFCNVDGISVSNITGFIKNINVVSQIQPYLFRIPGYRTVSIQVGGRIDTFSKQINSVSSVYSKKGGLVTITGENLDYTIIPSLIVDTPSIKIGDASCTNIIVLSQKTDTIHRLECKLPVYDGSVNTSLLVIYNVNNVTIKYENYTYDRLSIDSIEQEGLMIRVIANKVADFITPKLMLVNLINSTNSNFNNNNNNNSSSSGSNNSTNSSLNDSNITSVKSLNQTNIELDLISKISDINVTTLYYELPISFEKNHYQLYLYAKDNSTFSYRSNEIELELKTQIVSIISPKTFNDSLLIYGGLFKEPISIEITSNTIKTVGQHTLYGTSLIAFPISDGSGKDIPAKIIIDNTTIYFNFSYQVPKIKGVDIKKLESNSYNISIYGDNFDSTNLEVLINQVLLPIASLSVINGSVITCTAVDGYQLDLMKQNQNSKYNLADVSINVNGQSIVKSDFVDLYDIDDGNGENQIDYERIFKVFSVICIVIGVIGFLTFIILISYFYYKKQQLKKKQQRKKKKFGVSKVKNNF